MDMPAAGESVVFLLAGVGVAEIVDGSMLMLLPAV
jgi:hypothetical protein